MLSRYSKYNLLANNYLLAKQNFYSIKQLPRLHKLDLVAGHYKLNNLFSDHGLIFLNLTGNVPTLSFFSHGKRLKKTIVMKTSLHSKQGFGFLDKFVNSVIPSMEDLTLLPQKRSANILYYEWRVRCYFEDLGSSGFISDRLIRQGVFMPLLVSATFCNALTTRAGKAYLRMLRVPLLT